MEKRGSFHWGTDDDTLGPPTAVVVSTTRRSSFCVSMHVAALGSAARALLDMIDLRSRV